MHSWGQDDCKGRGRRKLEKPSRNPEKSVTHMVQATLYYAALPLGDVRAACQSPLLPGMTTVDSACEHFLCIQRHHDTSRMVYDADLWAERRGG